ncbi:MAG: hypothetical protein LBB89_00735 [Treponema sp.]|nr:hypothetical protein [Treponema sp.]
MNGDIIETDREKTLADRELKKECFLYADGYTYFSNNMNINGKSYKIILLTRETQGKNSKYYYHFLGDIKIEPDSGLA